MSFDGLTVGAGLGTTGEAAAKEQLTGAKVTNPGDYTVMFEALKNGSSGRCGLQMAQVARN